MPFKSRNQRIAPLIILAGILFLWLVCRKEPAHPEVENPYQKDYVFTEDWFTHKIPLWEKTLKSIKGKPNICYLEIGIYEGRSLLWMLENILTHPTARATAIDIFPDNLEERFLANLELSGLADKVRVIKDRSQIRLRNLPFESFDVVYIDGSHIAKDVLTDAVLSWDLLRDEGFIIFDDYKWRRDLPLVQRPKLAIDSFIENFGPDLEVIHHGSQVVIQKTLRFPD